MVKTIFKEIIITLLLILAIILVMGVIFYQYIPNNKVVPERVAYTTPENVAQEINTEVTETQPVNIIYRLDETDLKNAKKTGDYKAGKKNPFEAYDTGTNTSDNTEVNNSNVTNGNSNTNSSATNTNSSGEGYFPNKGTK